MAFTQIKILYNIEVVNFFLSFFSEKKMCVCVGWGGNTLFDFAICCQNAMKIFCCDSVSDP